MERINGIKLDLWKDKQNWPILTQAIRTQFKNRVWGKSSVLVRKLQENKSRVLWPQSPQDTELLFECIFTLPSGVVDQSVFTSTVDIHMPLWKNTLLPCVACFVIKHLTHGIPFNHQNINCPVVLIKPALDGTLAHPQSEVPFSRLMPLTRVLDAKLTKDTEWGPKLIKVRDKVEYITTGIHEIQKIIRAYFWKPIFKYIGKSRLSG